MLEGRREPARQAAGRALLVVAVVAFGAAVALTLPAVEPVYSWRHSMISDLGSRECVQRLEFRACSPRADVFNAGIAASGATLVLAAWALLGRWDALMAASVGCLGAGLLLVGLVPSDVHHDVHMAGAVLALPVAAAGMLTSAVLRGRGTASRRVVAVRGILGAVALIACLDHLWGDERAPVPRGLAEAVSVGALLAILLYEASRRAGVMPPGGGSAARPAPSRRSVPRT